MNWKAIAFAAIGFLYRSGGREKIKEVIDNPKTKLDDMALQALDLLFLSAKQKGSV